MYFTLGGRATIIKSHMFLAQPSMVTKWLFGQKTMTDHKNGCSRNVAMDILFILGMPLISLLQEQRTIEFTL